MSQITGVFPRTKHINFYNPFTTFYEQWPYPGFLRWTLIEKKKYSWYFLPTGQFVFGLKPPVTHQRMAAGGEGMTIAGSDPDSWKWPPGDPSNFTPIWRPDPNWVMPKKAPARPAGWIVGDRRPKDDPR